VKVVRDLEEGKDWAVEVVEWGEKSSGRKNTHTCIRNMLNYLFW